MTLPPEPSPAAAKSSPPPAIALFSGHRIDGPDRPQPRFPDSESPHVKRLIADKLEEWNAAVGYSAAASGGDILFLESMLERGALIHIILPTRADVFKQTSVADNGPGDWARRFDQVIARADSLQCLHPNATANDLADSAYAETNTLLLEQALHHAQKLACPLNALTVWDKKNPEGAGGTGQCVQMWQRANIPVTIIPPLPA